MDKLERPQRTSLLPKRLSESLGRPCKHCAHGGECTAVCPQCNHAHAASGCHYKLCVRCCQSRGVCDYHSTQSQARRGRRGEPTVGKSTQSPSRRGSEADSVRSEDNETTVASSEGLNTTELCSDNQCKINNQLHESGHSDAVSAPLVSVTSSASLVRSARSRSHSRTRTFSEASGDDEATNLGEKRRKKEREDEKSNDESKNTYRDIMLHLEMITKRVQEIEKLNKKVRDEILEKKLEEMFTRLQKLEEVCSNE